MAWKRSGSRTEAMTLALEARGAGETATAARNG